MTKFRSWREGSVHSADKKPQVYRDPADGKTKTRMVPVDKDVVKTNEVSSNTLGNYMRKSAADAGKPGATARQQDKRIGGQSMADKKIRKKMGYSSTAKVPAGKNEAVEQLDELSAEEKKLVNQMYDKKGNLTPLGKRVMNHGKKPGDKGYMK